MSRARPFYEPAGGRRVRRDGKSTTRHVTRPAREVGEGAKQVAVPKPAYLPRGGETGPQAGRSWRSLRLPTHRGTTDVVAGAYPFLAEAGLGSHGVYIGQDAWSGGGFCYDPWTLYAEGVLTNPNALLAGVVGRGKSCLAKSIATRSIAFGRRVYVPGDPKGEWTPVAQAVGGAAIRLGPGTGHRLNPLGAWVSNTPAGFRC